MFLNSNTSVPTDAVGIEHIDGLFSYAFVLTRDRSEAEDLVQETYVRAIGAVGRLRAESNVKGWLFTILRNIWLNQLRQRRSRPQVVEMDMDVGNIGVSADDASDPHLLYVSKMAQAQVREAIQQLPVGFRDVILLREFEDLSYQEIATVLGCPTGTVMSRLARARSQLRALLSAPWQPSLQK